MYPVDQVPIGILHLVEALVAQDAGVVHHHIDTTESFQRVLHDLLAVGDRVVVGHCRTAGLADLLDHQIGRRAAGAFTLSAAAQIIDQHLGTMTGEQQRMGAAEAATGAGHYYNLVFEADAVGHAWLLRDPVGMKA